MTPRPFFRYELRTTDVPAARAFYEALLGASLSSGPLSVSPLPEQALDRGAKAHWLGHVAVPDAEAAAAEWIVLGSQAIGPTRPSNGVLRVIVRDPFGAILGITSEIPTPPSPSIAPIAWHLHIGHDPDRACDTYAKLLGWSPRDAIDMGPRAGKHRTFAWSASSPVAGSMTDLARLPGVHTQWLYFFPVADLESALDRVRALGGLALEATKTVAGGRAAPCDDPQGGAFGLFEPEP